MSSGNTDVEAAGVQMAVNADQKGEVSPVEKKHSGASDPENASMITTPSPSTDRPTALEAKDKPTRPVLRPANSTNSRKKRVSFAKPEYLLQQEDVKTVQGCLLSMQRGSILTKVRQRGMFTRWFNLNMEMDSLCWQSTRKENGVGRIEVCSIHEIRHGRHSELLRSLEVHESDDCIFTVVHSADFQCMDLIAESAEIATVWVMGLQYLLNTLNPPAKSPCAKERPFREVWLEEMFVEADSNNDGYLDEDEIVKLCHEHNVGLSLEAIRKKFLEADTNREADSRGRLDREEFRDFFQSLSTRSEIVYLIGQYGNTDVLTAEQLQVFLQTEQRLEDISVSECKQIIQEFEPTPLGKQDGHFTIDGFTRYLRSPHCDAFNRDHVAVNHDMTQPLSHYFISASHNTVLTQAQNGPCEAMGITRALHRGCRLIDLDVYDGPSGPVVCRDSEATMHYLDFGVAVETVKEACFKVSQYPMFLRLEVHCTPQQQRVMVDVLNTHLDSYLYSGRVDEDALPSPSSSMRKVFLIAKKICGPSGVADDDGDVSEEEDESLANPDIPDPIVTRRLSRGSSVSTIPTLPLPTVTTTTSVVTMIKELSNLINIVSIADKSATDNLFDSYDSSQVTSLCEPRLNHYAVSRADRLMHCTKSSLARAYPSTTRGESSNMDPMTAWSCGVQFASMNCQTIGKSMDMNEGLFKANGYSGYYLKPASMRDECGFFSYSAPRVMVPGVTPVDLVIKIISGQMLPKPSQTENRTEVIDPFVSVETDGLDCDKASQRTRAVQNNGFSPVWDESFSFRIVYPEMTMVRFVVLDSDAIGSDFIGQFCIPLSSLKSGYRHVHLISNVHIPLPNASLFIHVTVNKDRAGRASSSKKKVKKEPIGLQVVGVKDVDAHFKKATPMLAQAANLMYDADYLLTQFKDMCGLSGWTTMRDCVRSLANRARVAGAQLSLTVIDDMYPLFTTASEGEVPEPVRKAIVTLSQGMPSLRALQVEGEKAASDLVAAYEETRPMLELLKASSLAGQEKKALKAFEAFSWNCLALKNEAAELLSVRSDVALALKQVVQASWLHGISEGTASAATALDRKARSSTL